MKNKLLILLIIISFFTINVNALELCEMSNEYAEWLSLSEAERDEYLEPAYCKSSYSDNVSVNRTTFNKNYNESFIYKNSERLKNNASVSRYSSVDMGLVTTPGNQYTTGSCWAFAANSLVETSALNEGLNSYNLSERHIEYALTKYAFTDGVNESGYNRQLDDGGNSDMSSSYYFRSDGPILESSMPFQPTNEKISSSSMPDTDPVLTVGEYTVESYENTVCSKDNITSIKEKVLNYGSVGISVYMDERLYLNNGKYYYYDGTDNRGTNHAVVIVGWDDSISSSNFKYNPASDGAFIVKNSWGTTFGDNGYFYLSYSDFRACTINYTFSDVSANEYEYNYNGSDGNANFLFNNSGRPFYASAKFSKQGTEVEYLDRVSLEVIKGGTYTVYVSTSNNLTDQSTWVEVGSKTAVSDGVTTVKFSPITITKDYTIIVKMEGSSNYIPLTCRNTSDTLKYYGIDITVGKNYYSADYGYNWYDLSTLVASVYNGCEPVIYTSTKSATQEETTFTIDNITSSKDKVYTFSDDYFTVSVSSNNVLSYELFATYVLDENYEDVTNMFNIGGSVQNGKIIIKLNEDAKAGKYYFRLKYNAKYVDKEFNVYSLLESDTYTVDDGKIIVSLGSASSLLKTDFVSNIDTFGASYILYDKNNNEYTDDSQYIGTMSKIVVKDIPYNIIVKGDINGDGIIKSNDSLLISRYLVTLTELNDYQKIAADVSNDSSIKSNDSLLISRYLVGLRTSL